VEAIGERRHHVAELVRRGGEAAQQKQPGIRWVSRLAVEDVDSVDLGCSVADHVWLHFDRVECGQHTFSVDAKTVLTSVRKNCSTNDADRA
jgi:hypothetical protein